MSKKNDAFGMLFTRSVMTLSIKMRLMFGIGLFFVLMTLPFAMLLVARSIKDHGDRVIAESKEIQHLVLEIDRGMEKAHRCHSSFFLYASERGFATAHEEYAQPSIRYIAQVVTLSETLKSRFRQIDDESWYHGNQVDVNFFLSSAKRFASVFIEAVELFTLLHAPERGLQSQLDQVIDAIASELRTEDTSSHLLMEMRIALQKYWSVRQRPVMQTALNTLFLLRRDVLHNQALEENKRQQLAGLMDQVTIIVEKILTTETAIKSRLNDLSLQSVATEKVSELLLRRAGEEVSKAEQDMRRIRMLLPIIMTAITLSGLILAMVLARMINRTVLLRVARLTEVAGEIRAGNLEVLAPEGDNDELGTLGRTFNFMLARLKVSITTLESQVEQRTAELSASEKRFRQLFEHSSNGVIVYKSCDHGEDFIIRDCNKAVESIEQRTRQEMIGRRVTDVFPGIRPFGLLAVMQAVWKTGQTAHHPVSLYVDDKTQGWRENGVYKLPSGEIVCVYDDRTAQKQAEAELQAITMKLQRIQKMEALGLMAGGVAHDLNNILSGIVGFPDLLLMHLPPDSPLGKLVLTIKQRFSHRV